MPVTFFPVTSPVNKTFAYLALALRAHYAICRYMFTVGFQYNFRQITVRFSAERRIQLMVSDMLFWCSWFKYGFIKLDLVTVGKFCFHFVVYDRAEKRLCMLIRARRETGKDNIKSRGNHVFFKVIDPFLNFLRYLLHFFLSSPQ